MECLRWSPWAGRRWIIGETDGFWVGNSGFGCCGQGTGTMADSGVAKHAFFLLREGGGICGM